MKLGADLLMLTYNINNSFHSWILELTIRETPQRISASLLVQSSSSNIISSLGSLTNGLQVRRQVT